MSRRLGTALGAGLLALSLAGCASVAGVEDPPTATVRGALQSSQAQAIAARVIDDAQRAAAATGPEGDALRAAAFTGDALAAAQADAKLASTTTPDSRSSRALTPTRPVVLAVSRGLAYPRSMVVQTTRVKSGLPVLYLLTTPDVRTPYRIAVSAPMLPSASVKAFDPVAQGSPPLGDGSGLAVTPQALVEAYAASLAFPPPPPPSNPPFAPDSFAAGVRASASSQSQGLNGVGTFSQQHTPKGVAGGLRVGAGKGALVFTVLERQDTLRNTSQGTLTPSAQFTALTGLTTVKAQATLRTLEFVVFFVPDAGQAVAVAAEEHLVSATGS